MALRSGNASISDQKPGVYPNVPWINLHIAKHIFNLSFAKAPKLVHNRVTRKVTATGFAPALMRPKNAATCDHVDATKISADAPEY